MKPASTGKFLGFPQKSLKFLAGLKRHNNREWFEKNRDVYEQELRRPLEELVDALASEFERFAPDMLASRKISIYRIYRDTRFSKDKSPYKTQIAASFPVKGVGKHEGAGFYFHFSPTELLIAGGLYMPLPEDLMAVREHIARNLSEFDSILKARKFRSTFGSLQGEQLARTPRGFAPDHPAAPYLKYKQFLAATVLPGDMVTTSRFYGTLIDTFAAMYPLIRFLNEPILKNRRLKQRQEALLGKR